MTERFIHPRFFLDAINERCAVIGKQVFKRAGGENGDLLIR